jgi:hypothetical protein
MFKTIAALALGAAVLTGAAACGSNGTDVTSMSPEATALTALGYPAEDLVPAADPSTSPDATGQAARPRALRRLALRRALRGNVEHGEVVVKTKNGDQNIDVQRGTVTAISGTSLTVKSADGFTLSWVIGSPVHVLEHRTAVQPSAVTAGEEVGVAGTNSGGTVTAVLILIPQAK